MVLWKRPFHMTCISAYVMLFPPFPVAVHVWDNYIWTAEAGCLSVQASCCFTTWWLLTTSALVLSLALKNRQWNKQNLSKFCPSQTTQSFNQSLKIQGSSLHSYVDGRPHTTRPHLASELQTQPVRWEHRKEDLSSSHWAMVVRWCKCTYTAQFSQFCWKCALLPSRQLLLGRLQWRLSIQVHATCTSTWHEYLSLFAQIGKLNWSPAKEDEEKQRYFCFKMFFNFVLCVICMSEPSVLQIWEDIFWATVSDLRSLWLVQVKGIFWHRVRRWRHLPSGSFKAQKMLGVSEWHRRP